MFTLGWINGSCSLVSVSATQSPTLDRIASGSGALVPDLASAITRSLSSLSTKTVPSGAVSRRVCLIGTLIPVMLYVRTGAPDGHNPSGLVDEVVSPSQAVPVWPDPANGGRIPRCGRSSGNAGRPLLGLNRISGL
jgi:hypothetical protein